MKTMITVALHLAWVLGSAYTCLTHLGYPDAADFLHREMQASWPEWSHEVVCIQQPRLDSLLTRKLMLLR